MSASPMYTGLSGIQAANANLGTTSHNIANSSTTGFKFGRTEFGDLVDSNANLGGGLGVQVQAINQQHQQGGIITTGNALDLAITGQGFFKVQDEAGNNYYTRSGSFHVNVDGYVVNNLGQRLVGTDDSPIQWDAGLLPVTNIVIDAQYNITATDKDGNTGIAPTAGAILGIGDFPNQQGLKAVGDTTWIATTESGAFNANRAAPNPEVPGTGNLGVVKSGFLEASNVDLTEQLVNMIMAQRDFQANSKTITTGNTLVETVTNMIR